ncbi:MAG TPA: hypothetical protein VFL42_05300 [Terriglobales bacterium]|jgi:hypothetical protein|nr:hypothetical protein [Terriglobales bacterium]
MSPNQMLITMLMLNAAARIRGCFRRWQQPVVRGPEWFFNVPVQAGFYTGPGKKVLQAYRMRMFAPIAVEILLTAAIFLSGHFIYFYWLVIAASIAVHVNHLFSVDLAERQAKRFAVTEAEQPVSTVMLSLTPRRLRDYSSRTVERFIIFGGIGTIAWLLRYYLHSPAEHSIREVFGVPALLIYYQLGFLLVKYGVVAWRTPIPRDQAEEHLQAREAARKMHLRVLDWLRVFSTATLVFYPFILSAPQDKRARLGTLLWVATLFVTVVLTIWQEVRRKAVLKTSLRARPMRMPDFLHTENSSRLVCYQPGTPMLLIRGARGYSLNLANKLTQLGMAYVAGLIALFVLLQMGHW